MYFFFQEHKIWSKEVRKCLQDGMTSQYLLRIGREKSEFTYCIYGIWCYLKKHEGFVYWVSLVAVCYTKWFDRDNPSGQGDYETLKELTAEYPRQICTKPLAIQAATLTGVPAESIGQVFQVWVWYALCSRSWFHRCKQSKQ